MLNPERQFDTVFCISVLEHVSDEEQFIADLASIVRLHGRLFLTVDYWDRPEDIPDTAHFHWMRRRIYCPSSFQRILARLIECGLLPLWPDPTWHGPQVYDYSFASLALTRTKL